MPPASCQTQRRLVHHVPPECLQELGVLAPGQWRELCVVPPASVGAPRRLVRDVSQEPGQELGILAPGQWRELRFMPLGTLEPLRNEVRLVPFAGYSVGERDFQPSSDPWRTTHVQDLAVQQVPPEQPTSVFLHVPWQHDRTWRLADSQGVSGSSASCGTIIASVHPVSEAREIEEA